MNIEKCKLLIQGEKEDLLILASIICSNATKEEIVRRVESIKTEDIKTPGEKPRPCWNVGSIEWDFDSTEFYYKVEDFYILIKQDAGFCICSKPYNKFVEIIEHEN